MIGELPACLGCRHFHSDSSKPYTCSAFPQGPIPEAIWVGGNPHTQPFPGDNGIRFEPKQGQDKLVKIARRYKRRNQ